MGDEATKIFLNTRGTMPDVGEDMLEFLSYVENTTDAFAKFKSGSVRLICASVQKKQPDALTIVIFAVRISMNKYSFIKED